MTPGACTIKLFTLVIVAVSEKARVFATAFHYHPSLIFVGVEPLKAASVAQKY